MAVISHKAQVVYIVVPKAGCTSIKKLFYQLEGGAARTHGWAARLFGRGGAARQPSIHQVEGYITTEFTRVGPLPDGYSRICIVRDPLSRLHSAWSNKVGREAFAQRNEVGALQAAGLEIEPSFGYFLENHHRYRELSRPAAIHTRPLSWHMGEDITWYDRLFKLEQLAEFESFIAERVCAPVRVPCENASNGVARLLDFEPRHVELARQILAADYALLAGLYDFDASLDAFRRKHRLAI